MREHARRLRRELDRASAALDVAADWGVELARVLPTGARLIAAGNGGSAAQVQHLTAELVGRYRDERAPYSAIALHAETSTLTALLNDYGVEQVFARQVYAHAREGDVVVLMSTSGRSPNLLAAARAARDVGAEVWAMTGAARNPLAGLADRALCVPTTDAACVQEIHLVAVHVLCEEFDAVLAPAAPRLAEVRP